MIVNREYQKKRSGWYHRTVSKDDIKVATKLLEELRMIIEVLLDHGKSALFSIVFMIASFISCSMQARLLQAYRAREIAALRKRSFQKIEICSKWWSIKVQSP